jgi:hypothetical protein
MEFVPPLSELSVYTVFCSWPSEELPCEPGKMHANFVTNDRESRTFFMRLQKLQAFATKPAP